MLISIPLKQKNKNMPRISDHKKTLTTQNLSSWQALGYIEASDHGKLSAA
ncbi:26727_t:CDS:2 [Gigaspora margarita]|uniref:26727_t:CDS:1 n=1 Tax=Gigaspora margarita TaxID=4874 RepID=A0ABN7UL86_GIGMA|nr:26727_t:CDS:2 [Gigaspora margarita]